MKLVKLLANLGYGSRKDVDKLIRSGAVTDEGEAFLGQRISLGRKTCASAVRDLIRRFRW